MPDTSPGPTVEVIAQQHSALILADLAGRQLVPTDKTTVFSSSGACDVIVIVMPRRHSISPLDPEPMATGGATPKPIHHKIRAVLTNRPKSRRTIARDLRPQVSPTSGHFKQALADVVRWGWAVNGEGGYTKAR